MPTDAQEVPTIRGPERVLTVAGVHRKSEFIDPKHVSYQLDTQTKAMIKSDVATVRFPVASVRRLTMQGSKVVFEEEHSHSEKQKREVLVSQHGGDRGREPPGGRTDQDDRRTTGAGLKKRSTSRIQSFQAFRGNVRQRLLLWMQ